MKSLPDSQTNTKCTWEMSTETTTVKCACYQHEFIIFFNKHIDSNGVGEKAQGLRALAEDRSSVLSTHMVVHNPL